MSDDFLAFTLKAPENTRFKDIITQVKVGSALNKDTMLSVNALWDTGASSTCISKALSKKLGLGIIGKHRMRTASGIQTVPEHIIDITLPNNLHIPMIPAVEFVGAPNFDILIGMDLITLGDFAITNAGRTSCVSFRFPPASVHIDYIK